MNTYTKLSSSILASSIWSEDDRTRIVWITMLAMADQHGEVHASVPGLARLAGVPVEACELAIAKFLAPDRHSKTPDHEGRRIAPIDGGWELLNHSKYRAMASKEDSKARAAERQRRCRDRKTNVTPCHALSRSVTVSRDIAEADTDTKAHTEDQTNIRLDLPLATKEPESIDTLWLAFPSTGRNRSSKARLKSELAKAKGHPPIAQLAESVKRWCNTTDWKKDRGQFVPGAHIWVKERKWESEPEIAAPQATGNNFHSSQLQIS